MSAPCAGLPMFKSSAESNKLERISRAKNRERALRFGIEFLDDATRGIFRDDLVLLGAPSGMGKTQLCCNIALANMEDGKKVHYIALEAGEFEIERRLKFPLVMERFYADRDRPRLQRITFADWLLGVHLDALKSYEDDADKFFETAFRDLFLFYKQDRFGLSHLTEAVLSCSSDTDLIIVDHVHYFDFDDDNENRAIREIAKTVRTLALEEQKPIILVAHLRKRDRANEDLVAGLEEFHGSSDLYKIATKVITMSPGRPSSDGLFETYFRIPKNRIDGGVTRYSARELFNPKKGGYEKGRYKIGWAEQKRSAGFAEIDESQYPEWARVRGSVLHHDSTRAIKNHAPRETPSQRMPYSD